MNVHNLTILGHWDALKLRSADFLYFEDRWSIFVVLCTCDPCRHQNLSLQKVGLLGIFVKDTDNVLVIHIG